jgi:hypothetical protein
VYHAIVVSVKSPKSNLPGTVPNPDARAIEPHQLLEHERIQLSLLAEVDRGLEDVHAGRTIRASEFSKKLRKWPLQR